MGFSELISSIGVLAAVVVIPAAFVVTRSNKKARHAEFFRSRLSHLRKEAGVLTEAMLTEGDDEWSQVDFPMFSAPGWIPSSPYDLSEIQLEWEPPARPDAVVEASRRNANKVIRALALPREEAGYSQALIRAAGMDQIFNGKIYRPVLFDMAESPRRMVFTEASYFDYLDTSEILAFEAEVRRKSRGNFFRGKSYRRRLGTPFNLRNRVASLGVGTLTVRVDGAGAGFFLHRRNPRTTVNNASMIGLIPAGEFAPSDATAEALHNDLDLWRNIMREFAEEFLGIEDAQGGGGSWIDYDAAFPYRELGNARKSGKLRISVLGIGFDPLAWKPNLFTVCVVDSHWFDRVCGEMVSSNTEGLVIKGRGLSGLPFDEETIDRYCNSGEITPNARACLRLAWRHRTEIGL